MRCESASGGESLPCLPTPVLFTSDLQRLSAFYEVAAGFELLQHVPGVCATLRRAGLVLQLWARAGRSPGHSWITLEAGDPSIFELHRQLAQQAQPLLDCLAPQLSTWGAWEFGLTDIEGNRLVFVQWAHSSV